jgi:hypothetical protein
MTHALAYACGCTYRQTPKAETAFKNYYDSVLAKAIGKKNRVE